MLWPFKDLPEISVPSRTLPAAIPKQVFPCPASSVCISFSRTLVRSWVRASSILFGGCRDAVELERSLRISLGPKSAKEALPYLLGLGVAYACLNQNCTRTIVLDDRPSMAWSKGL